MKPIHYIIAASVILNAVLLVYTKPFAPRAPAAHPKAQAQKSAAPTTRAPNLQTATPEQLIKALTAMGIPPDIIKIIVKNRLRKIDADRLNAVVGSDPRRYWQKEGALWIMVDKAKHPDIRKLQWGVTNTMKELFGSVPIYQAENLRPHYGDISDEKLQTIAEIESQVLERLAALKVKLAQSGAPMDKAAYDQQNAVIRQGREEITKLLTPDELYESDLRYSRASDKLASDTKLLDLTEQEFRDIFSMYQKHYNTSTYYGGSKSDFASEEDFHAYRNEQLRQILGEDRYADFLQASNPAHEKLNLIVQRLDLPLSAAREVVSVQTDLARRAAAIDADATLTNADRAAHYTALAQEAQARITQTLGERGYTAYRENSQNWIQTLESGKPPPAPAK